MNNKGLSLLEVLVALTIAGMIGFAFNSMLLAHIKVSRKIETNLNVATDKALNAFPQGTDHRTYAPNLGQCVKLEGASNKDVQWYAKRQDTRVVGFYKDSTDCSTGYIGTLTALTNPTYDCDITNTFWNVSGDGSSIRILVHNLNIK